MRAELTVKRLTASSWFPCSIPPDFSCTMEKSSLLEMWIPAGLWLCSPGSLVVSSEGARQIKHVELVSVDTLHFARLTPTAESQREERRCDCTRQRNTGETQTEHKYTKITGRSSSVPSPFDLVLVAPSLQLSRFLPASLPSTHLTSIRKVLDR